jgi:hypothetical protein
MEKRVNSSMETLELMRDAELYRVVALKRANPRRYEHVASTPPILRGTRKLTNALQTHVARRGRAPLDDEQSDGRSRTGPFCREL